ncbi:hypothetical protein CTKZ_11570 [Cellulomonas algicola]|uniref:Alkaline shock response membrane anchor protein AmaP n=1 Tax=Cellulomonas algicola TaxID=2071633 RepID=A0A401UY83_9CELL|nr:hypothetical protein CTKZ_11570 [Cellulomonas algicola]
MLAVDRVLLLLLGLVLVVVGVAAVGWQVGFLADVWPSAPRRLAVDTGSVTGESGYPLLLALVGVVLVVLGLWWLLAHLPRRSVGPLRLPGGDRPGRLVVDPGPAVATAAGVLAEDRDVRSARGAVLRDRGETVVRLRTTVEPGADLPGVVAACDRVLADLAHVLPTERLRSRVEISVLREPTSGPRVQ